MGKRSGPRRGSLAYHPRKRATRQHPDVKAVNASDAPCTPVFAAYKAGMTHVIATDAYQNSKSYGHKIAIAATIMECPPLFVFGVRAYVKGDFGNLLAAGDVLYEKLDKELERAMSMPKKHDKAAAIKGIEAKLKDVADVRLLVHTRPSTVELKKKPEIFEMPVGGKPEDAWKFAMEKLGKEITVNDALKEGDWVDVFAVTKGKGTCGPVKRFGIKIQRRKNMRHHRFPGSIGAWGPSRVFWTVPMQGQLGYQRRTEFNKRILKIGGNAAEVNPRGGIVHYGLVSKDYMLIEGSVPGPKKRLVLMRKTVRFPRNDTMPAISEISQAPQQ